jgi:hypothetical protein
MLPEEGDIEGDYDGLWLFRAMYGRIQVNINFCRETAAGRESLRKRPTRWASSYPNDKKTVYITTLSSKKMSVVLYSGLT